MVAREQVGPARDSGGSTRAEEEVGRPPSAQGGGRAVACTWSAHVAAAIAGVRIPLWTDRASGC